MTACTGEKREGIFPALLCFLVLFAAVGIRHIDSTGYNVGSWYGTCTQAKYKRMPATNAVCPLDFPPYQCTGKCAHHRVLVGSTPLVLLRLGFRASTPRQKRAPRRRTIPAREYWPRLHDPPGAPRARRGGKCSSLRSAHSRYYEDQSIVDIHFMAFSFGRVTDARRRTHPKKKKPWSDRGTHFPQGAADGPTAQRWGFDYVVRSPANGPIRDWRYCYRGMSTGHYGWRRGLAVPA